MLRLAPKREGVYRKSEGANRLVNGLKSPSLKRQMPQVLVSMPTSEEGPGEISVLSLLRYLCQGNEGENHCLSLWDRRADQILNSCVWLSAWHSHPSLLDTDFAQFHSPGRPPGKRSKLALADRLPKSLQFCSPKCVCRLVPQENHQPSGLRTGDCVGSMRPVFKTPQLL